MPTVDDDVWELNHYLACDPEISEVIENSC